MTTPPAAFVEVTAVLEGLSCRLTHGPSGAALTTVPPKDNGGTGASFSPTDLVAAALAACAVTTLALVGAREALGFVSATARVEKHMSGPPRRISALVLEITQPASTPVEHRARLEEIARGCPVARTLHPDCAVPLTFVYR